jgi:hypothetical protein
MAGREEIPISVLETFANSSREEDKSERTYMTDEERARYRQNLLDRKSQYGIRQFKRKLFGFGSETLKSERDIVRALIKAGVVKDNEAGVKFIPDILDRQLPYKDKSRVLQIKRVSRKPEDVMYRVTHYKSS